MTDEPTTFSSLHTTEFKTSHADRLTSPPAITTKTDVPIATELPTGPTIHTTADIIQFTHDNPQHLLSISHTEPTPHTHATINAQLTTIPELTTKPNPKHAPATHITLHDNGTLTRTPITFDPPRWETLYQDILLNP